ncbi:nuclear transport factor 2 family protein [Streptomyces sp. NRRL F-5123]|uniref:nuclear transport factor 2 family protein n=1 Tax=Streptomyces sp. NRRL F-5123 TaxID=1463856 RepID=UPI0004E14F63|nr:nuclear transport factor 2 family protein [Streptomyces sp. NRRL F-5123]
MSTTRHLINRQRRLAAVSAAAEERAADREAEPAGAVRTQSAARARARTRTAVRPRTDVAEPEPAAPAAKRPAKATARTTARTTAGATAKRAPRGPFPVVLALLAAATVLLGGFAAFAASRASGLHDSVAAHNTALTDTARTSEVKGQVAEAVNAVFSYDYADPARTDSAAERLLTGKAVQQYATMLAQVRAQAPTRKLVLTTTVTDTGVDTIDGDRAHLLVYADQRNTSTAKAGAGSTYAPAMFAVDAVRTGGIWKIAAIDTFG